VNPAVHLLMNLGKQMLFDLRSCAYLWSNLYTTSQKAGESFVTNARKDCSNFIRGIDQPRRAVSTRSNRLRRSEVWQQVAGSSTQSDCAGPAWITQVAEGQVQGL